MKYGELVKYVSEIFNEYSDMELTLRQIFYRLVSKYGLKNKRSQYTQLSRQLVKARENGDIDETRIVDRARETLGGDYGFESVEEFLKYQIERFKEGWEDFTMPIWESQDYYIEIVVEKDALSRVISNIANKYNVRVCPSRGYSSYTYVKDIVDRFNEYPDKHKVILHFSDHDPSGLDMTRDLQERLHRYGGNNIEVKRVALIHEQVKKYNLLPNPTKKADPRSKKYTSQFGYSCWELDAIEPRELERIVKNEILKYIDARKWNERIEEINRNKEIVKNKIEALIEKWGRT